MLYRILFCNLFIQTLQFLLFTPVIFNQFPSLFNSQRVLLFGYSILFLGHRFHCFICHCACAKQQEQCNAVCPRKRDIADGTTKINDGSSCTAQVCNFNSGLTVTSIVVSISCPQGFLPVKDIVATANQNVLLFFCCPFCLLG